MAELLLPEAFRDRLSSVLGAEFDDFIAALNSESPVSVRVNTQKLIQKFNQYESVPWASEAFYLPERISFTLDPLFHAGCYYVQEAGSMFLEEAIRQTTDLSANINVLDLCAAPGGKSTHILSLISSGSLLVSNEVIPARNKILRYNIQKWGSANVIVTQNEPADFSKLPSFFDLIVVDAPCSGEGLFRKDPDSIGEWSEKNVAMCSARQSEILEHAVTALKPGGVLIYSTCTYEDSENDGQCRLLERQYKLENIALSAPEAVVKTEYGLQFYPHRTRSEGFFIAAFRKPEGEQLNYKSGKRKRKTTKLINDWIDNADAYEAYENNGELYAFPQPVAEYFEALADKLYVRQAGIHTGTEKHNNLIPSHQLALSNCIRKDLPAIEVGLDDALKYLRMENFNVETDLRGWALVKFEGFNLGWVKILNNRINNYFPKGERIRIKMS